MMKRIAMSGAIALAMATVTTPAFAQHVTPANTAFSADGPATLGAYQCYLTLPGTTGADVGGAHTGHAAGGTFANGTNTPDPSPECVAIVVNSGDFEITSYTAGGGAAGLGSGTGNLRNVSINACPFDAGPIPFTAENVSGGVNIILPVGSTIGGCPVSADLIAPGISLVP